MAANGTIYAERHGIKGEDLAALPITDRVVWGAVSRTYFTAILLARRKDAGLVPDSIRQGILDVRAEPEKARGDLAVYAARLGKTPDALSDAERREALKKTERTGRALLLATAAGGVERITHTYQLYLGPKDPAVLDRYGNIEDMVRSDGFDIDAKFYMIIEGENPITMAKSTGLGIIELAMIFNNLRPDIVLVVGDRFDVMAPTIASAFMNIPIAHTMGGEISGTIDENIRHAITKMAHLHFPANEDARNRIVRMGENPDSVFNVGCPRMDLVKEIVENHHNGERIDQDKRRFQYLIQDKR